VLKDNLVYNSQRGPTSIRALLVEDNPGDVLLLRQMLRGFMTPPMELVNVERLEEAFQHVTKDQYDIILLDLSLPDSQGFATFERLHEQVSHLPIVVLTGFDDEEFAVRAVRMGAQDYLVKGEISDQLLMRAIRYAIERKRTESTLRESQMRYRALFENANTGIFLITLDGFYLNINQQAVAMLGITVEEAIGLPSHHFYRDGQPIDFCEQSQRLLAGEALPIYECEVHRQDGSALPLEINVTLVRDAFETPLYIQSIARDILRRRQMESALYDERAQLAQRVAERTTELSVANSELMRNARLKDEFLATVSHELRTPLSVILTLSEALQERIYGAVSEPQQKALQRIGKSGRHLLALINDVLDVSKIESGKLDLEIGPTSVQSICEDSLQMVQEAATGKQVALSAILDKSVTIIGADGRRLMQILLNLLNNAIKFTPEGGTVELNVNGDKTTETVTFTVSDSGIGIAQEDMSRLFQPFVQLDSRLSRRYQGAGLGLALVYRLVKLHGGSVSVQSELGRGSTFTIALPWLSGTQPMPSNVDKYIPPREIGRRQHLDSTSESSAIAQPIPAPAIPAPAIADGRATYSQSNDQVSSHEQANGFQVLIVEDHGIALDAMVNYLQTLHYDVLAARSGVEALAMAREHEPDLILMDIQMPEMDGLEAIQTLRQQAELARTPIIALTALAMPGDRERCLQAGANVYISKPIGLRNLHHIIEEIRYADQNSKAIG